MKYENEVVPINIRSKTCFQVAGTAFLLFLAIYYWNSVADFAGAVFHAASALLLGGAMAYVINIPMSFYEKRYFPHSKLPFVAKSRRAVCLLGAIITLLLVIAGVIGLVIPELVECVKLLIKEVPAVLDAFVDWINEGPLPTSDVAEDVLQWLSDVNWHEKIQQLVQTVLSGVGDAAQIAVSAVSSVATVIIDIVIGLIFAVYLLMGKERLLGQFRRLGRRYLPGRTVAKLRYVLTTVNSCFHRFIVGQCTEAVILGALCMLGMWIFRFPYAMMVGTLIGFMALLPIVGAFIGAGVGAFMILTVSPIQALWFLVFIVVLQQLEGNLIYPRVVGSSIGLPGVWVLAAVTVGGGVLGIGGMLLGVPLTAAVYQLLREDVKRGKRAAGVVLREESIAEEQETTKEQT